MARTKASVGAKVSFGKSSKAQKTSVQPSPSTSGRSKSSSSKPSWSGGNAYCPRETPNWQQPITRFFRDTVHSERDGESSGSSHTKKKKINVIDSDTESEDETNRNGEKSPSKSLSEEEIVDESLDQTVCSEAELLPLVEDESLHKIGDYFKTVNDNTNNNINDNDNKKSLKNKGTGKSSKNKSSSDSDVIIDKENCEPVNVVESEMSNDALKKRLLDDSANDSIEKEVKKIKI